MKQEDYNELQSKHPSPEAQIQHEERKREALERGCRCANHPAYHDPECHWRGHTLPQRVAT